MATHAETRIEDLDTATRIIVSAVEFVTHNLMAAPAGIDPERLEDELVAMLTRYLRG